MGGTLSITAQAMVAAAVLKVGIKKAVEGEGYDLTSADALVDGIGGAIEAGLYVVGNLASIRMMAGLSKTKVAQSIAPAMRSQFGDAGTRVLAFGLEGTIDGTIGGVGEGLFHALAEEETWENEMGGFFSNVGASVALHGSMGAGAGGVGSVFLRGIGQTYSKTLGKNVGGGTPAPRVPGRADPILDGSATALSKNTTDQTALFGAVQETNAKMQRIANEVADEVGVPHSKMSIKGQKSGAEATQERFVAGVMEKNKRNAYGSVGEMTDMTRGRFDLDSANDVESAGKLLKKKLDATVGPENVDFKGPRKDYKRYHILARDPETGIWHEFQVGTKATTDFVEGMNVRLPAGVKLHGEPNFHVVMYDTLGNIHKSKIRQRLGLPDDFADSIGLSSLEKRYNALMRETGTASSIPFQKAKPYPKNFVARQKALAEEIAVVAQKVEDYQPGLLQKLDSKLQKAGGTVQPKPAEMPDAPVSVKTDDSVVRRVQDDPLPELRETHKGKNYEDFPKAKAFLTDGQGKSMVDPETAKQGALGDCYFIAGCAAVARANPDDITKIVKDNADGTFDVTLHLRDAPYSDPIPVTRTIDAQLPTNGPGSPLYAKVGQSTKEGDEVWMALLEKRLAQEKGSYDLISGGKVNEGMNFRGVNELLTGKSEFSVPTSRDADELLQAMDDALKNKKPITADTVNMEDLPDLRSEAMVHNVFGNHAYAIREVNLQTRTVNLQNPWGKKHVADLSIDDFKRFYRNIRVGS